MLTSQVRTGRQHKAAQGLPRRTRIEDNYIELWRGGPRIPIVPSSGNP
jgi:hypothetical protein